MPVTTQRIRALIIGATAAAALAAAGIADARRVETLSVYAPADEAWPSRPDRTYISATTATQADMVDLRDALIRSGARNVNLFLPDNVIVAELPRTVDLSGVIDIPGIHKMSERDVRPQASSSEARRMDWIREAYELADRVGQSRMAVDQLTGTDSGEPLDMVMTIPPERVREIQRDLERRRPDLAPSSGSQSIADRTIAQNSEILTGKILAQFVYPESNGTREAQTENWGDDIGLAVSGTSAMMLDYQGKNPSMHIHVTFAHFKSADCGYEPIRHNSQSDGTWIVDVMHNLGWGITLNDAQGVVHEFNTEQRTKYRTDWVFTSFIANARNAPNHQFANAGYTAYAYLGGPYNVNPHPAGRVVQGLDETLVFSQIVQHETGHIFWALDEYPGAPSPCTAESGYLDYENLNLTDTNGPAGVVRCSDEVPCIMHSAARADQDRPFCEYSQGMMGVIDDNGNSIADVFESTPVIRFEVAGQETTQTGGITINLKGISTAVPNQNPQQQPASSRRDYAAPLRDGFFTLGGREQVPLTPLDGRWDEAEEDFTLGFDQLPVGRTLIEFRVRTEAGLWTPWYKKYVHFIGVNFAQVSIYARPNGIEVTWKTVGETWGSRFHVFRQAEGEDGWEKIATDIQPFDTQSGFVAYRMVDRNVRAGKDYRYYIESDFTLMVDGKEQHYNPPSNVVATTAMIPISGGSILSKAAPNPFNDEVTVSVSIPESYESKNATSASGTPISYQQRVPTRVEVAVYDVLGRRIRELALTTELIQVMTLKWDGRDSAGRRVPNGIYFIKAKAGEELGSRKVLMVR